MTHTYKISGLTCNGCRSHVEDVLNIVEGIKSAKVDLERKETIIEMDKHL